MPLLDANKDAGRGVSPAQVSRLYAIARERFVSSEEVKELLVQVGVEDPRDLTRTQYDDLCGTLETMDPPTEGRAVDPQTGEIYEDDALGEWVVA